MRREDGKGRDGRTMRTGVQREGEGGVRRWRGRMRVNREIRGEEIEREMKRGGGSAEGMEVGSGKRGRGWIRSEGRELLGAVERGENEF